MFLESIKNMLKNKRQHLVIFTMVFVAAQSQDLNYIDTIPPTPENELATGFPYLTVTAQLQTTSRRVRWYYGESFQHRLAVSSFFGADCHSRHEEDVNITCAFNFPGPYSTLSTNLTFNEPLSTGVLRARITEYDYSTLLTLPNKTVKDCENDVGNYVIVRASFYNYSSSGSFDCSNGGRAFYRNETLATENTTCLYNAKWDQEDDVKCWTAPYVEVTANDSLYEGDDWYITCHQNVQQNPNPGTYYFDGTGFRELSRSNVYIRRNISRDNNNDFISCGVSNPYTRIYPDTGRSKPKLLTVYYAPYRANLPKTLCRWVEEESSICSVEFQSNPPAERVVLEKDGVGTVNANDAQPHMYAFGNTQTYLFQKSKVALQDNGTYTLTIYGGSAFPGQSLTIAFDIVVSRSESEPLQNSASGLTVAAFIFAMIITAVLIAIVTWYCCKSRNINLQKFISLGSGSSSQSQTVPAVTSQNATLSPTNKQSEPMPKGKKSSSQWNQSHANASVKYDSKKESDDSTQVYVNIAVGKSQSSDTVGNTQTFREFGEYCTLKSESSALGNL